MRVLVDATELRPGAVGGVATGVRLLLEALHERADGVEVTAAAPGPVDVPKGVRTLATGGPKRPLLWRRSRALRRAAKDYDLFHSPVTAFPDLRGQPVTATVHELPFVEDSRLEGPLRALVHQHWLSRALSGCRALVAPSEATLRQMCTAHPACVRATAVVPHPAPPTPAHEQKEHDDSLLFVGRLDRRKRVDALLAAAARTTGQIRLVGPHAERARFRVQEAARRHGCLDRLMFLGLVDGDTLDYLYRQARAVALVSVSEGFGFPVLEALARAVPVVVGAGTGAAEVGGDAVLAVAPDDTDAVAAALERAADPEYRRFVAVAGPRRALEFSAARTAAGYEEVFRRALAGERDRLR